jgi:hypothetical protein
MEEERMHTSTFIRRHILRLPQGAIFSTREMLNYGRRSAVDQCLHRLVKAGRIIRLAWGLFLKDDIGITMPCAFVVATEKARAFGKQILTDAVDAAKLLNLTATGNQKITYAIQGHSSSFKYGKITINFRGICARKMALGDGPVGLAIKALWQLGKSVCDQHAIARAINSFKRPERRQFNQSCHLMPTWMTEIFQN